MSNQVAPQGRLADDGKRWSRGPLHLVLLPGAKRQRHGARSHPAREAGGLFGVPFSFSFLVVFSGWLRDAFWCDFGVQTRSQKQFKILVIFGWIFFNDFGRFWADVGRFWDDFCLNF